MLASSERSEFSKEFLSVDSQPSSPGINRNNTKISTQSECITCRSHREHPTSQEPKRKPSQANALVQEVIRRRARPRSNADTSQGSRKIVPQNQFSMPNNRDLSKAIVGDR